MDDREVEDDSFIDIDFEQICRVCLKESTTLKTIHSKEIVNGKILSFSKVFDKTIGVQLQKYDGLPQNICNKCKRIIVDFYVLFEKCQNSQKLLQKILRKSQTIQQQDLNQIKIKVQIDDDNTNDTDIAVDDIDNSVYDINIMEDDPQHSEPHDLSSYIKQIPSNSTGDNNKEPFIEFIGKQDIDDDDDGYNNENEFNNDISNEILMEEIFDVSNNMTESIINNTQDHQISSLNIDNNNNGGIRTILTSPLAIPTNSSTIVTTLGSLNENSIADNNNDNYNEFYFNDDDDGDDDDDDEDDDYEDDDNNDGDSEYETILVTSRDMIIDSNSLVQSNPNDDEIDDQIDGHIEEDSCFDEILQGQDCPTNNSNNNQHYDTSDINEINDNSDRTDCDVNLFNNDETNCNDSIDGDHIDVENVPVDSRNCNVENVKFFVCHVCNAEFSKRSLLKNHICSVGGTAVVKNKQPKQQQNSKSDEIEQNEMFCKFCDINILSKFFNNHMEAHNVTFPVVFDSLIYSRCGGCHQVFTSSDHFRDHINKDQLCVKRSRTDRYTDVQYLINEKFDYKFYTCSRLSHVENTQFICDYCSNTFNNFDDAINHYNIEHFLNDDENMLPDIQYTESIQEEHVCGVCSDVFPNLKQSLEHVYFHLCTFHCPVITCGVQYDKFWKLHRHLETNHDMVGKHVCTYCDKFIDSYINLKKHMRTECKKRLIKCKHCEKTFFTKGCLNIHEKSHLVDEPYKCDVCSKGFYQSGDLKTHYRIHTGVKPYVCGICGAAFRSVGNRNDHMSTHESEKKFDCTECNKKFKSERTLRGHLALHTGVKKFKCNICSKQFSRNFHLTTHLRTHLRKKTNKSDAEKL